MLRLRLAPIAIEIFQYDFAHLRKTKTSECDSICIALLKQMRRDPSLQRVFQHRFVERNMFLRSSAEQIRILPGFNAAEAAPMSLTRNCTRFD